MVFFFFRMIALLLIAVAVVLLGADAVMSLESNEIQMRSISEFSEDLLKLGNLEEMVKQSYNMGKGPREFLLAIVRAPAWAVSGLLGIVMAWVFADRG